MLRFRTLIIILSIIATVSGCRSNPTKRDLSYHAFYGPDLVSIKNGVVEPGKDIIRISAMRPSTKGMGFTCIASVLDGFDIELDKNDGSFRIKDTFSDLFKRSKSPKLFNEVNYSVVTIELLKNNVRVKKHRIIYDKWPDKIFWADGFEGLIDSLTGHEVKVAIYYKDKRCAQHVFAASGRDINQVYFGSVIGYKSINSFNKKLFLDYDLLSRLGVINNNKLTELRKTYKEFVDERALEKNLIKVFALNYKVKLEQEICSEEFSNINKYSDESIRLIRMRIEGKNKGAYRKLKLKNVRLIDSEFTDLLDGYRKLSNKPDGINARNKTIKESHNQLLETERKVYYLKNTCNKYLNAMYEKLYPPKTKSAFGKVLGEMFSIVGGAIVSTSSNSGNEGYSNISSSTTRGTSSVSEIFRQSNINNKAILDNYKMNKQKKPSLYQRNLKRIANQNKKSQKKPKVVKHRLSNVSQDKPKLTSRKPEASNTTAFNANQSTKNQSSGCATSIHTAPIFTVEGKNASAYNNAHGKVLKYMNKTCGFNNHSSKKSLKINCEVLEKIKSKHFSNLTKERCTSEPLTFSCGCGKNSKGGGSRTL